MSIIAKVKLTWKTITISLFIIIFFYSISLVSKVQHIHLIHHKNFVLNNIINKQSNLTQRKFGITFEIRKSTLNKLTFLGHLIAYPDAL